LIAGGAGEGPLLRDAWFAGAFLCGVQQRRGVVLGIERRWTSDAFRFLLLIELLLCAGGGAFRADCVCFYSRRLVTAPQRRETRPFPSCLRSPSCGLFCTTSASLFPCLLSLLQIEFPANHPCLSPSFSLLPLAYLLGPSWLFRIHPIFLRLLLFPR
jgi:hypothetical protein